MKYPYTNTKCWGELDVNLNRYKKRIKVILFFIIFIGLAIGIYFKIDFNISDDTKNKNLLKKYGWEVIIKGGLLRHEPNGVNLNPVNNLLDDMAITASQKIGLNPLTFVNKPIDVYKYELGNLGRNEPLNIIIWTNKKKVICAYIYHNEDNLKIKYWSLNTSYEVIVNDINEFYKDHQSKK